MKKQPQTATAFNEDPESKTLKDLTVLILSRFAMEKIICFGSMTQSIRIKSCFTSPENTMPPQQLNSYYILAVPAAEESCPDVVMQGRIEEALKTTAQVTVIVHRMEEINRALQHGSSFFITIYKKGSLLYDRKMEPFAVPSTGKELHKRIIQREKFWNQWIELSESFLSGAHFYAAKGKNGLAIFMLHQSLQHCYSAMIRILTGYRTNTNGLGRLFRLMENALPEHSFSSKNHTPEEARLTSLLLKGFGEARYSDKFEVSKEEVSALIIRTGQILQSANQTCLERIQNIKTGKIPYITSI